jgi:hypothetical protein
MEVLEHPTIKGLFSTFEGEIYFKMSGSMINSIVKNKSWVLHS